MMFAIRGVLTCSGTIHNGEQMQKRLERLGVLAPHARARACALSLVFMFVLELCIYNIMPETQTQMFACSQIKPQERLQRLKRLKSDT